MKRKTLLVTIALTCFSGTINDTLAAPEATKPSAPTHVEETKMAFADSQARLDLFDIPPTVPEQTTGRASIDDFLAEKSDMLVGFDARNNRHR